MQRGTKRGYAGLGTPFAKIILIMAVVIVGALTACGSNDKENVRGEIKENSQTETENLKNSENSEEVVSEETEENETISLGKMEGSVYESKFIGLGWTLPEGWTFLTDEQMNQINNFAADMLDNEQLQDAIENATLVCDMYAMDYTGNTINIQLEKLNAVANAIYDADTYVDASLKQLSTAMETAGYTDVQASKTTVTIAGKAQPGIAVQATYNGVVLYEKLACIKVGDYMCVITVATTIEDNTDSILSNFYALEK